jgi:ABC-2 type transport system permease protein
MKGYIAFTRKEIIEQIRTFKWLIIVTVFFIFGMLSPLTAKLMPIILSGMKVEGMEIIFPDPTAMDSYVQFFKNVTQMGIVVILLVFGGTLSNELTRGTLINILAKGLRRHTVILSKYTAALLLWTMGYVVASVTTYGYTLYLFGAFEVENLVFSLLCFWLFGCFVIALIFLSSTLTGGNFGGLILTALALVVMLMLNISPKVEKFNPITLAAKNVKLLAGLQQVEGMLITIWITISLTVLCLLLSMIFFNKKKI